jgi:hypothetical protein
MKVKVKTKKRKTKFSKLIHKRKSRKMSGGGGCISKSCVPNPETIAEMERERQLREQQLREEMIKEKTVSRLKKNFLKKKENFFNSICTTSNVCITFGIHTDMINKYFNNFVNLDYVVQPIKLINSGDNGFINEITYMRGDYVAHAVLKSSNIRSRSESPPDNLGYEYIVGKYINKIMRKYTCFLETYGLFKHNLTTLNELNKKIKPHIELSTKSRPFALLDENQPDFYRTTCKYYISLLIQHIKDGVSLEDAFKKNTNEFINYDIITVLYQVYMPLAQLVNVFTHYDLHINNVLLIEPVKGGYIDYYYHLDDGTITNFKSKYLAKIIDYGRSYFYEDESNNSRVIYNKICSTIECGGSEDNKDCGEDAGYSHLNEELEPGSFFYIVAQKVNKSHDLRLLNNLLKLFYKSESRIVLPSYLKKFLESVKYDTNWGSQIRESGSPVSINNVVDAFNALNKIINNDTFKTNNDNWHKTEKKLFKIGELHTYTDGRDVEFIKEDTDLPFSPVGQVNPVGQVSPVGQISQVTPDGQVSQVSQVTPDGQVSQVTPPGQVSQVTPPGQVSQVTPDGK